MLKLLITFALLCSIAYSSPLTNETRCDSPFDFMYPNGSCLPTCLYPYQVNGEFGAFFCDSPCPDSFFNVGDDICVEDCEPEWIRWEEDILYCDQQNNTNGCPENAQFLYYNGTCLPSCESPFKIQWNNGSLGCVPDCQWRYFNFWTDRCVGSCSEGFYRYENKIMFCDQPPQSDNPNGCPFWFDFKHPNGSCLADCPDHLREIMKGEYPKPALYCISPCPGRYIETWNGTCTGICEPEFVRNASGILYCDNPQPINTKPCPDAFEFRYSNGSCSETCYDPYKRRSIWENYCDARCLGSYLNPWDDTCMKFCENDFIQVYDGVTYCDQPTNTSNGCPNPDDFRYLNGSCLPSCLEPFTSEWDHGSLLCVPNCPYYYFNPWTERCLYSCDNEYIRKEHDVKYCDQPPRSNLPNGCPFYNDFKHTDDGSCSQNCLDPKRVEEKEGSLYCNLPCPVGKFYNPWKRNCSDTCRSELIKELSGVIHCLDNPYYTGLCPSSGYVIYPDGSCQHSCPSPYWISIPGIDYVCNSPCPAGQYIYEDGSCVMACDMEGFAVSVEDGMVHCRQTDCVIQLNLDGSKTTNCTARNGSCPPGYFRFDDLSCNQICPAEFTAFYNATCTFPCTLEKALYPDGRCLDTCTAGYTLRMEGSFMICDKDERNSTENNGGYSATVEIYLRYDIPLKDFNAGGYLEKFITMMAKLLDVTDSDIKILSLREGSTIIESEVLLKSDSLAGTKSKANSINQKLTEAAESKGLNLEGVGVLNHKFSVVIPEGETNNDDVDGDKSSSKALAIGLGVGLAVVAVGIITLVVYSRYQKKQKLLKVREQIQGKAKTVAETPARRDEEICSFVDRRTENMSPQTVQPEADQLSPRIKIEPEKKEEEEQAENEAMDEIMKNIDENL